MRLAGRTLHHATDELEPIVLAGSRGAGGQVVDPALHERALNKVGDSALPGQREDLAGSRARLAGEAAAKEQEIDHRVVIAEFKSAADLRVARRHPAVPGPGDFGGRPFLEL